MEAEVMRSVVIMAFLSLSACLPGCSTKTQHPASAVSVVGAMKNVMWKGQLQRTIDLDTISNREHLYGLGPAEYLSGELLIIDGRSYKSTVLTDTTMRVEETFKAGAPFFVYGNVDRWTGHDIPESVRTLPQFEGYLDRMTTAAKRPFAFRLSGTVESAAIHIVNLPSGATVSSPDDSHRGRRLYTVRDEPSDIVGFFSTEHQAVFTHHDTYVHMHLLTADRTRMGHLDEVLFKSGSMKLYLPAE